MLQNIKVDLIYYLMPSDFEMEFNMCGCCRMRLLTDKVDDKQEYVNLLSRAANRSRIIIACGALFGNDGLLNITSKALGSELKEVDNAEYGISGGDTVKVIDGATPLVSPQGIFGGCIIESGSQTIILLTESKSVRKAIMQSLIHPYIEDISITPEISDVPHGSHDADAPVEDEQMAEDTELQEENQAEDIEISSVSEELKQTSSEATSEMSENTDKLDKEDAKEMAEDDIKFETPKKEENVLTLDNNSPVDLYINPERADKRKVFDYARNYKPSESDSMFLSENLDAISFEDEDRPNINPFPYNKVLAILVAVLIVVAVALCVLVFIVPYLKGMTVTDYAKQIFSVQSAIRKFL